MAQIDTVRRLVEPIVADLDVSLYDLDFAGGTLRITVEKPGGIDLETIAELTRQVSRQLDLDDPISGRYTLEVSSPGLERNLRTAEHWRSAVGERVKIKTAPDHDGERRYDGVVTAADESSVTLQIDDRTAVVPLDAIERARTHFEWRSTPRSTAAGRKRSPQPVPSAGADATKESETG